MGEVEEQRYVCRICSKSCVSGKSLGGHMRVHLAQIVASKKAAAAAAAKEIKVECDAEDDDDGDDDEDDGDNDEDGGYQLKEIQSNSEEKMKQEFEEGDQSNSYELRENPKKSWRISDPKNGLHKKSSSCKECGKEFASLRALSGHMRCHSIKNKKEVHLCKECGRGFDSMRAMFGHMKTHSKRLKVVESSAESLSDLENFCPIRRKRSRIRYNGTVNPLCSGLDASDSAVCELEEAEEAAKCLVMLSRGVRSCFKFDSNAESSEDDSAYFDAVVTSCRSKRFCGNENVSEFDELDLKFVAGDQTKVGLDQNCDDKFLELAIGNNGGGDESGFEKNCCENGDDLEMMEGFEKKKPKLKPRGLVRENGRHKMVGISSNLLTNASLLSVNEADFKHDQCNGGDDQSLQSSKRKGRECPICFKVFTSGQALGGHKRAHYNGVVESKNREAAEAQEMLDLNFPISGDVSSLGFSSWFVERSHEHEALALTT